MPEGWLFPGVALHTTAGDAGPSFLTRAFQTLAWISLFPLLSHLFLLQNCRKAPETPWRAGGLQVPAPPHPGARAQTRQSWTDSSSKSLYGKTLFPVFLILTKLASKQTESFSVIPPPHVSSSQMEKGNSVTFIKASFRVFPWIAPNCSPSPKAQTSRSRP